MEPSDDSELLRQFAEKHSDEAFASLVKRHINLVYSVALRHVGNPHHAEEITQAVFIILAKKAASLRHDKALSSWLFQATHLTASNSLRSEIRRHRREQEAYMQSAFNESNNDIWKQIAPFLDTAVAGLNEKDRRAIVLRFYEGRNLREVGVALGANEDAAKKRVARALEKLRRFFVKRGIASTTATLAGAISSNSVQAAPVALSKTTAAVALAKGATASTSTVTLIKGVLKVMAWTKAKAVAAATTVAVMLTAGTTTLVIKTIHASRAGVYQPIPDNEPDITARVRGLKLEELRSEDCTPEFWQQLQQSRQSVNPDLAKVAAAVGPLQDITLVERTQDHGRPSYLYRMKYQNLNENVLFRIIFDGNKIAYAKGYPEPK